MRLNKFLIGLIGVLTFLILANLELIAMSVETSDEKTEFLTVEDLLANLPIAEEEPKVMDEPVIEEPETEVVTEPEPQELPEPEPDIGMGLGPVIIEEPEPVVTEPTPTLPHIHTITIPEGVGVPGCEETNECYLPPSVEIFVGHLVVWENKDTAAHTVTSGNPSQGPDGNFDSGLFMSGVNFEVSFDNTGTYPYFCMVHPWMLGEVIVNELEETPVTEPETEVIVEEEPPEEESLPETETVVEQAVILVSVPQGTSVPGCENSNECFLPASITIKVGDTVSWTNDDTAAHTVTSGVPSPGPDGVFDSSLFMAGTTFEHAFVLPGSFEYFCMVHPWMQGQIIVE